MTLESVPPPAESDELLSVITPRWPVRPPCLDYDATDYQIHPCDKCEMWWAEVVQDSQGNIIVREWHESTCEVLHEIDWV